MHPTWGRVMAPHTVLHRQARAIAFADDGYIDSELKECLLILAGLTGPSRRIAVYDLQLGKCKLYIKGNNNRRSLVHNSCCLVC